MGEGEKNRGAGFAEDVDVCVSQGVTMYRQQRLPCDKLQAVAWRCHSETSWGRGLIMCRTLSNRQTKGTEETDGTKTNYIRLHRY